MTLSKYAILLAVLLFALTLGPLAFAQQIAGRVQSSGSPVANSVVTLYAAAEGAPTKLSEAQTKDDGTFDLKFDTAQAGGEVLYLIGAGGEPKAGNRQGPNTSIALMAVLGATPPKQVTINELTTVASVWTAAQFLKGPALSGNALGLKIAAGNVPNLVDLATGGLGPVIQDPMNSTQTTTLSIFSTLGDLLAGCVTRVQTDACSRLFEAATPPGGPAPTDTLAAAEAIALHTWNQPAKVFAVLDYDYPTPHGPGPRPAPFRPYLLFAPGTWTIGLVYAGGGLAGLGGTAFDSEGNAWSANNQMAGSQSTMFGGIGGTLSELAPNGRPISPMTFGFTGGGVDFPGWGFTIAADGRVWVTSIESKTISVFDKTGKPLSPPAGYNFNGQLGAMQGINATPNGDVWAVDAGKSQIVYLPNGDPAQGRILCRTVDDKPTDGTCQVKGPFHVVIDQQNRILVSNANSNTVTRFPASDPSKAEEIKVDYSPHALAVDSRGNVWVANTMGEPSFMEKLHLVLNKIVAWVKNKLHPQDKGDQAIEDFIALVHVLNAYPNGSVSMIRPDGSQGPGSPFNGGHSIIGPWGITIDGNDHVWIANGFGKTLTELCGVRTDTCPPGYKTGDPISPPKTGYAGHGMQYLTAVGVDPAGNVWAANNIDLLNEVCIEKNPDEAMSTRCGGNGFVEFFGVAKPVKTPVVGGQVRGW